MPVKGFGSTTMPLLSQMEVIAAEAILAQLDLWKMLCSLVITQRGGKHLSLTPQSFCHGLVQSGGRMGRDAHLSCHHHPLNPTAAQADLSHQKPAHCHSPSLTLSGFATLQLTKPSILLRPVDDRLPSGKTSSFPTLDHSNCC